MNKISRERFDKTVIRALQAIAVLKRNGYNTKDTYFKLKKYFREVGAIYIKYCRFTDSIYIDFTRFEAEELNIDVNKLRKNKIKIFKK